MLFCVKLWDVESAGEQIKPLIGPETAVIPLQNGVDAAERLIPILGRGAVMGGVAQISASIIAPGVITQVGTFMRMIFGELDGKRSRRGEDFLALCQKAGFDATLSDQILTDFWMKFILLAANASITAADAPADRQAPGRSRHSSALDCGLPGSDRDRPRQRRARCLPTRSKRLSTSSVTRRRP